MHHYRSWLFALALLFFAATSAAQPEPPTSHRVLALVVTSNKSSRLERPDLHYADDDGAKYRELFRMFAPDEAVSLLTAFDRDSARLFPDLATKVSSPDRGHVFAEAARLGRMATEATARGEKVDFYFVFAGHGDVDQGRGFLELADGAFYADDLEKLLKSVPSTQSHVLIDSCNSFFLLAARKPGGRRFATATEAATSLNQRLPNVGVFLSTSAEAETFEWSEVGGGIFSHIVRSGLSGAADANNDGEVSYDELAAFAHTAAADVKNPRFRPQVFARGPSGLGRAAMLRTREAVGTRLRLPTGSGRITVRDEDQIPWLDAHAELDAPATIVTPLRFGQSGVVDTYDGRGGVARRAMSEMTSGGELALAGAAVPVDARGAGDVFRALFARPFGPRAFAQYATELAEAPPAVYGVSDDDTRRMRELLGHAAENARSQRLLQGLGAVSGAIVFGAFGASGAYHHDAFSTGLYLGIGGVLAGTSLYRLVLPSREERALAWFSARRSESSPRLTYEAEARLFEMAEADRRERVLWRWVGIGTGALAVGTLALMTTGEVREGNARTRGESLLVGGGLTLAAAVGFAVPIIGTFSPTYTERMAKVWQSDPARDKARLDGRLGTPSFTLHTTVGAGSFGLGGTF